MAFLRGSIRWPPRGGTTNGGPAASISDGRACAGEVFTRWRDGLLFRRKFLDQPVGGKPQYSSAVSFRWPPQGETTNGGPPYRDKCQQSGRGNFSSLEVIQEPFTLILVNSLVRLGGGVACLPRLRRPLTRESGRFKWPKTGRSCQVCRFCNRKQPSRRKVHKIIAQLSARCEKATDSTSDGRVSYRICRRFVCTVSGPLSGHFDRSDTKDTWQVIRDVRG